MVVGEATVDYEKVVAWKANVVKLQSSYKATNKKYTTKAT